MKMIKYLLSFPLFLGLLFAENINTTEQDINTIEQNITEEQFEPRVDCLILEDEDSIICKFEINRQTEDQELVFQWINPEGELSRSRDMQIPAGHGSIYDYRYIDGREAGNWIFKVIYKEKEYSTKFELKN
jgi:hypothetical protein